jgi:hypothetical protein
MKVNCACGVMVGYDRFEWRFQTLKIFIQTDFIVPRTNDLLPNVVT